MPLKEQTQENKLDSKSFFIERNPDKDYYLDYYRNLLSQIGIDNHKIRLFEKYEINGLSEEEIFSVNYQIFSTLNLDHIVDPTELFDEGFLFPFTKKNQEADAKVVSALKLLQLNFPYRDFYLRRTEILIFKEDLTDQEKKTLKKYFFEGSEFIPMSLRNQGFTIPDKRNLANNFIPIKFTNKTNLKKIKENLNLKMSLIDLQNLYRHYHKNKNKLSNLEIKFWDQYYHYEISDKDTTFLKTQFNTIQEIITLSKRNFNWQNINSDDLIIRICPNLSNCSSFDSMFSQYQAEDLKHFWQNSNNITLCKQIYDLSKLPLLATLISLPVNVSLNLDIQNFFEENNPLEKLLLYKQENQFLIIISPENRDQFFKNMQYFDLEAQVIGKVNDDELKNKTSKKLSNKSYLNIIYQGKKVIELFRDFSFIPDNKFFTLCTYQQELTKSIKDGFKAESLIDEKKKPATNSKSVKKRNKQLTKSLKQKKILFIKYPGNKDLNEEFLAQCDYDTHSLNLLNYERFEKSVKRLAFAIDNANLIILPDAYQIKDRFIATDKLLTVFLEKDIVKQSINAFLDRKGKIIAFGNAFEALIQCGLLPYGRYRNWGDAQGYFYPYIISYEPLEFDKKLNMPIDLWDYSFDHKISIIKNKNADQEKIETMINENQQILGTLLQPEQLLYQYSKELIKFLDD